MNSNSTPQPLDDLLAQAERYAEFSLRYGGRVPGTLLLHGPSGPGLYVPKNLGDEQAKNDFAAAARHLAIAHDATAVVMVLEAWARQAAPGVPLNPSLPPSQAPDRQEVVALLGEAAGVQQVKFLPIQRTAAGQFSGFGEARVQACDRAEGRFAQILPAQPATAEEKARSQTFLQALGMKKETLAQEPKPAPRHWHRV